MMTTRKARPTRLGNRLAAEEQPSGSRSPMVRPTDSPSTVSRRTANRGLPASRSGRRIRQAVQSSGKDTENNVEEEDASLHARSRKGHATARRTRTTRPSGGTQRERGRRRSGGDASSMPQGQANGDQKGNVGEEEDGETRVKREQEEQALMERWAEEYYEIVEQLPLELHRSYTLMRELETKSQGRISLVASHVKAYRDARIAYNELMPEQKANHEQAMTAAAPADSSEEEQQQDGGSDADGEGEEDLEVFHELYSDAYTPESRVARSASTSAKQSTGSNQAETTSPEDVKVEVDASPSAASLVPTRAARLSLLSSIAQASSDALRIADEKMGLAVSAYDWVDRQIRRLDADLQKSENSLLLGLRAGTEASRGLQDALGVNFENGDGAHRWDDIEALLLGRSNGEAQTKEQILGKHRGRGKHASKTPISMEGQDAGASVSTDRQLVANGDLAAGMAIDPNEPTYCYCDEVSYGDMVACDNEDCPREWFHYHCVGFTQPPKGRWFCLFCAPPGYKGSGTYPPDAPCLPSHIAATMPRKRSSGGHKRKRF